MPRFKGEPVGPRFKGERISDTQETIVNPVVAEYAGGVNRAVAQTGDFFLTNPLNVLSTPVRNVMGDVTGLPPETFKASFEQGLENVAPTRNFMEPGLARDVVQSAGEWTPAFATLRPEPALQHIPNAKRTQKMIEESAPSIHAMKSRAHSIYQNVDDLGARFDPMDMKRLAAQVEDVRGLSDTRTPKSLSVLDDLQRLISSNSPIKPTQLDDLRQAAGDAAMDVDALGRATRDAKVGRDIISLIDNYVGALSDDAIQGAKGPELQGMWKEARRLTHQRSKSEAIEHAIDIADSQRSTFQVALRGEFLKLERNLKKGKLKGWSKEEIEAVRKVAHSGRLESLSRMIGKFGAGENRVMLPGMGASAGYYLGNLVAGPPGGIAGAAGSLAVGKAFSMHAEKLMTNNARAASAIVRAGRDARKIVAAYVQTVPKAKQNPQELAGLLLRQKAPLPTIELVSKSTNPIIANAGFFATRLAESAEDESQGIAND